MPDKPPVDKGDYPPDLWTATRAEYVTRVRTMKKDKKGCPWMILVLLIRLAAIAGTAILLS